MYEIYAEMPGGGFSHKDALASVICFDPRMVLVHLKDAFGSDVEIDWKDHSWKAYDWLKERAPDGTTTRAMTVAENDALRRGPIHSFTVIDDCGVAYKGNVERYDVVVLSDTPFPESLKIKLLEFLNDLPRSDAEVRSVRIDGNNIEEV